MVGETGAARKPRAAGSPPPPRVLYAWIALVSLACQGPRTPAEARIEEALAQDPGAFDAVVAEHLWGGWLRVPPDGDVRDALAEACALERAGLTEEAIERLGEALEGIDSAPLLEARGALYAGLGFPRAAAGDFQRALGCAPERAEGWYALGRTFLQLELSRQALDALTRAQEAGCDEPEIDLWLARVYRDVGRRGRAARHFARAIERDPLAPDELLVEAARLASPPDAISSDALSRALSMVDPSNSGGARMEGAALVRSLLAEGEGETDAALAAYVRASDVGREALEAWTEVALLALEFSDPETASEIQRLAGR